MIREYGERHQSKDAFTQAIERAGRAIYEEFTAQRRMNEIEERVYNRVMDSMKYKIKNETAPELALIGEELRRACNRSMRR